MKNYLPTIEELRGIAKSELSVIFPQGCGDCMLRTARTHRTGERQRHQTIATQFFASLPFDVLLDRVIHFLEAALHSIAVKAPSKREAARDGGCVVGLTASTRR
jgi:hypothetical protein